MKLANHADQFVHLALVQAGHHLIEQDHLGAEGHGTAHFEPAPLGQRQLAGQHIGAGSQPDLLEHDIGALARVALPPVVQKRADHHVLDHREGHQRLGDLERASQAALGALVGPQFVDHFALQPDLAGGGFQLPGQQVEQRRLAGSVGPDDADDLARRHIEAHVVDGGQAEEALADVLDLEERGAHLRPSRWSRPPRRRW